MSLEKREKPFLGNLMTPKAKKFNPEYAKQLIKIAEGDLESAKILASSKGGRPENIFFIAQQSIEKSLKSVLIHHQKSVPLTHDLEAIMSILPESIPLPKGHDLIEGMSEFATVRRYEEGYLEITKEEIKAAIQAADSFLIWAKKLIQA